MNGRRYLQQPNSTDLPLPQYRTTAAPVLRTSWSSSTATPSAPLKQHSYHQSRSRHSRSSSHSFVQDNDNDNYDEHDIVEETSSTRHPSTLQYRYSSPVHQRQPFYQYNQDYAIQQRQGQRLQNPSRQVVGAHRQNSQHPSTDKKIPPQNQRGRHHDEIRVQRKPLQQPPPIITMDTNKEPSYLRKQRQRFQKESAHLPHHHVPPVGWKMSGQYDHLVLRSPLSSTPPSLYDSSSSSTTLSSSSDTHQRNGSSLTSNGLIYHRKRRTAGGNKHVIDYQQHQHQQQQSQLTTASSISSLSSASSNPNRHAHSSMNSISTRSRHSYEDQSSDALMKAGIERPRRYSQGDCSNRNIVPHSPPQPLVSRRVSTPKLRRVCSAKPYIDHSPPDDDDDDDNDLVDAASLMIAKTLVKEERMEQPTFWNPRSSKDVIPVKRTLSRRLRGLLLPQRSKLDVTVSKDHHLTADYQWSLNRPMTPPNDISFDNDTILEDQENGVMDNPFYMISQSWDIVDQVGLQFNEDDFTQMDTYATSVQQIGPTLTPQMLSQKFLVRPYRRDLYRLRIIYIWILQNIAIIDQRTGKEHQGGEDKTTGTNGATQSQPSSSKISFKQRFISKRNAAYPSSNTTDQDEELEPPTLNVMHGDGLLPEGGNDVDSFDDWLYSESAQQVLLHRACSSSIGMANLFCEMATAAGFHDTRVVYGYLRAPKDSIGSARMDFEDEDNCTLIQNHAWCCVKVEGEYRFVDCWLASSFQPQNKSKIESHWFLTKPAEMIYTHFPQESVDQCLEPSIPVSTFFALPYVWASFFSYHIKMIRYNPEAIHLVDDQICHLTFRVDMGVICFAYIDVDNTESSSTTLRCLAQSRILADETGKLERIYKVKAVLPPGHDYGWLKIYAGPSTSNHSTTAYTASSGPTRQENISNGTSLLISRHNLSHTTSSIQELPPLAMCFRLTAQHHHVDRNRPFEFVHLHPCRHEFYIREPQCYQLYPLQTYNFLIRGDDTHHKLAIKSPSGKLYKLMYYPQEHTYDGSVKISESGKWSLISLLHHAGGWYVVATWECRS